MLAHRSRIGRHDESTRETHAVEQQLEGKVALVTGASKGIGAAVAGKLARAGAAVMISSRKQEALDAAAADIMEDAPGTQVETFAANAGEPDQAEACVSATLERLGAVDILVNSAATNPHFGALIDIDLGAWDKVFRVNLRGALVWTQLAWRGWMREHGGVVLNMTTTGAMRPGGGLGAYNVSKAGLIHLTKILASELAPGVRVNALAPGLIQTDFSRVLWEGLDARSAIPMGRIGTPEDIARAALYLTSDASSWVTGETLVVDGGSMIDVRFG
jgi:NAD(P)-dependent dehydrogenase (short-subunit alcohol dehydrogenase family)